MGIGFCILLKLKLIRDIRQYRENPHLFKVQIRIQLQIKRIDPVIDIVQTNPPDPAAPFRFTGHIQTNIQPVIIGIAKIIPIGYMFSIIPSRSNPAKIIIPKRIMIRFMYIIIRRSKGSSSSGIIDPGGMKAQIVTEPVIQGDVEYVATIELEGKGFSEIDRLELPVGP